MGDQSVITSQMVCSAPWEGSCTAGRERIRLHLSELRPNHSFVWVALLLTCRVQDWRRWPKYWHGKNIPDYKAHFRSQSLMTLHLLTSPFNKAKYIKPWNIRFLCLKINTLCLLCLQEPVTVWWHQRPTICPPPTPQWRAQRHGYPTIPCTSPSSHIHILHHSISLSRR